MDTSRRDLLKMAAALLVDQWAGPHAHAFGIDSTGSRLVDDRKVIVIACGGVRWAETFQETGFANIPNLYNQLLPQGTFFTSIHNAGVTSHYNTTSSILTGDWQRIDDWGKTPPENPTIFEHFRKTLKVSRQSTWFISSNKALTKQIGASSVREFGPKYGANVVFPKQLIINAVARAALQGRAKSSADRNSMRSELEAMLNADNYDGMGWSVSDDSDTLDDSSRQTVVQAIGDLVRTNAPVTGDEFTFLVSMEVMRRFSPSLLVMTFSDVEVAHFGSYSMHLAGIRTFDRLVHEFWQGVQGEPAYRGRTTLFVLPEFSRDFDGSSTNGFFNHRFNDESTRKTWMMCLGAAAKPGEIIERPVKHVDICPTIANLFEFKLDGVEGKTLPEVRL